MEKKCKIALVDDHGLFRNGLKNLLELERGFEVVIEAEGGEDFLAQNLTQDFDVVLMDIDMPKMSGFELSKILLDKNPKVKIICLSMHAEREYYHKMMEIGVKGFLLKSSDIEDVISVIWQVHENGICLSETLVGEQISWVQSVDKNDYMQHLSEREVEVLLLICKGMSNFEIGEKLFISKRTVDKHRSNILEKTGCKNTANLVVYAIKNNLAQI